MRDPVVPSPLPDAAAANSRERELVVLNAIAAGLNSAADVQQALEQTLARVTDLFGLRTGWIWLLDPETQQFYNAAALNLPPYLQEPVHMTGTPCRCIQDLQHGRLSPANVSVLECSRLRAAVSASAAEATAGLRYHASVPLVSSDRPLGILNLTAPAWRELSADELRLLSTVASQLAVAIERARLAEESRRLDRAEERARLAREIHDTLAQGLTAIGLHLEGALRRLDDDPAEARARLQRALDVTRESLEEARSSVLNLRAAPLAGQPLAEALATLCRTFTAETGVRVSVRAGARGPLPTQVEVELYRIAQEALSNVRKHAAARDVTLFLLPRASGITLTVHDNGRGFDPLALPPERHGILGMRERARLLGGRLRLHSRPGQGTTVSVAIPLPPGAERASQ